MKNFLPSSFDSIMPHTGSSLALVALLEHGLSATTASIVIIMLKQMQHFVSDVALVGSQHLLQSCLPIHL